MQNHQKLAEENTYGMSNNMYQSNKDIEEDLDADEIGSKFSKLFVIY